MGICLDGILTGEIEEYSNKALLYAVLEQAQNHTPEMTFSKEVVNEVLGSYISVYEKFNVDPQEVMNQLQGLDLTSEEGKIKASSLIVKSLAEGVIKGTNRIESFL